MKLHWIVYRLIKIGTDINGYGIFAQRAIVAVETELEARQICKSLGYDGYHTAY